MGHILLNDIGQDSISETLTAKRSDCLVGNFGIFSDSDDEVVEGTMPDKSGSGATYNCLNTSNQYHIAETGYHNGSEIIKVNPIPATTANASTILTGYRVYLSNGQGSVYIQSGSAGR